jgi:hypothetical protein
MLQRRHLTVPVHRSHILLKPFPERNSSIEIIRPYEYDNGIDILSVFIIQLLGLSKNMGGLMATDPVAERPDSQNLDKLMPIDVLALELTFISYRISKESHPGAIPLALDFRTLRPARLETSRKQT